MVGIAMRDWAVEIIASDIANQLGIPCVQQKHCIFAILGLGVLRNCNKMIAT